MKLPSEEEFSKIHQKIEDLQNLPTERIPSEITRLRDQGEDPMMVSYLQLYFSLPAEPKLQFAPGEKVAGRYTIQKEIGRGGMGVVYRATQDLPQRDVALKVIDPQLAGPELLEQFRAEIKALGQLRHEAVVSLHDADWHNGTIFYVMDLVDGLPAHRFVREKRPSRDDILRLLVAICEAVQHVHEIAGIIHRDLKPGNILVDPEGRPYLLDFGLAMAINQLRDAQGGAIWGFSGTPKYMSPEQFLSLPVDPQRCRSVDIYALGVIAYELLTGTLPYEFPPNASWVDICKIIVETTPKSLRDHDSSFSRHLSHVVAKAMSKDPAQRYLSAASLGKALLGCTSTLPVPKGWLPVPNQLVPATKWTLQRQLGQGAIGEVWLAHHDDFGNRVFKFCHEPAKLNYLRRESTFFHLLSEKVGQHPNFVRLYDVSLEDPPYYLMMDYVEGGDLLHWAQQVGLEKVPLSTRIEIVAQAAEALQAAHDAGILHCDIKPGNLLIKSTGDPAPQSVHVYISDFGVGQMMRAGNPTRSGFPTTLTDETIGRGTQIYMAPEVLSGGRGSVPSDIYSLGVVLYQFVLGDFSRAVTTDWDRSVEDPLVREDLARCLLGTPADRFSGAAQLAQNLRSLEKRRASKLFRELEMRQREKKAYWKGVARTSLIWLTVVLVIAGLALLAQFESNRFRTASSLARFGEAKALAVSGQAGSKETGLKAIRSTRPNYFDPLAFRNVAATLLAATDVFPSSSAQPGVAAVSADGRFRAGLEGNQLWLELPGQPKQLLGSIPAPSIPIRILAGTTSILVLLEDGSLYHYSTNGQTSDKALDVRVINSALSFTDDGQKFAAGVQDGSVLLFDHQGKVLSRLYSTGRAEPYLPESRAAGGLAFNSTGKLLAVASPESHHVLVWEIESQRLLASAYHSGPVNSVLWLDDRRFVTACVNAELRVWNIGSGASFVSDSPAAVLTGHQATPRLLSLCGSGQLFVSIDDQGRGLVWHSQRLEQVKALQLPKSPEFVCRTAQGFAVQPQRTPLVLDEWRVDVSACFSEQYVGVRATSLRYRPEGKFVAAASAGSVLLLDASGPLLDVAPVALLHSMGWLSWSNHPAVLVATRDGPRILPVVEHGDTWKFGHAQIPWPDLRFRGPVSVPTPASFVIASKEEFFRGSSNLMLAAPITTSWKVDRLEASAGTEQIALWSERDQTVRIWSERTNQFAPSLTNATGLFEFGAHGNIFAHVGGDAVELYDCRTWQLLRRIQMLERPVALTISGDGRKLMVAHRSSAVELYDLATGQLLIILKPPIGKRLLAVGSSPDGTRMLLSTEDGFLHSWMLAPLERELTALSLHW